MADEVLLYADRRQGGLWVEVGRSVARDPKKHRPAEIPRHAMRERILAPMPDGAEEVLTLEAFHRRLESTVATLRDALNEGQGAPP